MIPRVQSSRKAPLLQVKARKGAGDWPEGDAWVLETTCLFAGGGMGVLRAIHVHCALFWKFHLNKEVVHFLNLG